MLLILALFTVGCSGQTEDQALQSLREMTRDGKLPPEDYVAGIESRWIGRASRDAPGANTSPDAARC